MGFGGYVIWFGVVDYNGRATCTGSQSPLVKNRSEPQDLVRRLPVCVGTVNTGGSMGIRHASVWWRVGLRGVGSWQYNVVRKLRHASLCRICAVIPRTPVHSVIRIPSINFIMNTTTTTTSTATTNAATSRPSISSMPDLRRAVPVMISRMLSTPRRPGPGGHGRARDHSPQPSTSRASVGHGAGMLSPAAKRGRIVGSPAPRLATPMPRAPLTFTTKPDHEAFSDIRLGFKDNVMRLRLLYDREVVVEMTSSSTLEGLLLDRPSWDLLVANRDVIEHHAKIPVGDEHGEQVRVWIELKKKRKNVSYAKVKIFNRKVYIDLRDYWYPNGPEAGIAGTKRGVCLS